MSSAQVSNTFGPLQRIRGVFLMMPAATADDWAVIARRMTRIPQALDGHRESLAAGAGQGLFAAPRQVTAVTDQLGPWLSARAGAGWSAEFAAAAAVPPACAPNWTPPRRPRPVPLRACGTG